MESVTNLLEKWVQFTVENLFCDYNSPALDADAAASANSEKYWVSHAGMRKQLDHLMKKDAD